MTLHLGDAVNSPCTAKYILITELSVSLWSHPDNRIRRLLFVILNDALLVSVSNGTGYRTEILG